MVLKFCQVRCSEFCRLFLLNITKTLMAWVGLSHEPCIIQKVPSRGKKKPRFDLNIKLSCWWLKQPIWTICSSNWIVSLGMNMRNIWNHHPEKSSRTIYSLASQVILLNFRCNKKQPKLKPLRSLTATETKHFPRSRLNPRVRLSQQKAKEPTMDLLPWWWWW